MSKYLFIVALVVAGYAKAQPATFLSGDVYTVLEDHVNQSKLFLIDVYTDWCGPCKKMDKEAFQDQSIGGFMDANFVNIKLNPEKDGNKYFIKKHNVRSYPTLLFVDGKGEQIARIEGYRNKEDLLTNLKGISRLWYTGISNLQEGFQQERFNQEELKELLEQTNGFTYNGKAAIVKNYINTTSLVDMDAAIVKSTGVSLKELDEAEIVKLAEFEISLIKGKELWQRMDRIELLVHLQGALKDLINGEIETGEEERFEKFIDLHQELATTKNVREIENFRLDFYEKNDHERYANTAQGMIEKYIEPYKVSEIHLQEKMTFEAQNSKEMRAYINSISGEEGGERTYQTLTDSLSAYYKLSQNASKRLNDISLNFIDMFPEDKQKLEKAFEWQEKSIEFYPYELAYYAKLSELYKSQKEEMKSQEIIKRGQDLSSYKLLSEEQEVVLH